MEPVTCIMITNRVKWALKAIKNFKDLSYVNKHLCIISQCHLTMSLEDQQNSCIQLHMDKKYATMTLGSLRNLAFNFIPNDHYIFAFDDDDWRHPNFIQLMMEQVSLSLNCGFRGGIYQFTYRLNHNLNTKGTWVSHERRGDVHLFAKLSFLKSIGFKYKELNTLEDVILHDIPKRHKWMIENELCPQIYIRFTHNTNSSPFVRLSQKLPTLKIGDYTESKANDVQERLVLEQAVPISVP